MIPKFHWHYISFFSIVRNVKNALHPPPPSINEPILALWIEDLCSCEPQATYVTYGQTYVYMHEIKTL